jgi:hypothetical protein
MVIRLSYPDELEDIFFGKGEGQTGSHLNDIQIDI